MNTPRLDGLPRLVWFHWMQGRAAMPRVVRECLNSWTTKNPDWKVVFLEGADVWQYLDRASIPADALLQTSPQVYANAIRLSLLVRYGGVWADATTWCRTPLSEWLIAQPGEFFAFSSPGEDRMMANWFLASLQDGYLVRTLAAEYLGIFKTLGPLTAFPDSMVKEILKRAENTDVFLEPLLLSRLRGYPYFLFHYLFAFLYRRDARFKRIWDEVPTISAAGCHAAQLLNLLVPADEGAKAALRAANPPMHKLSWRLDPIEPGSLLHDIMTGFL